MESILNKIKPDSSPIVEDKKGIKAWIVYDDVYLLRINPCGKKYNGTYEEVKNMPIVAHGFLVYNIIEKRYSFNEKFKKFVCKKYNLYSYSNVSLIRKKIKLLKEENRDWRQIKKHLFKWIKSIDKKSLRINRKKFIIHLIKY
jgi:hypothetical protein